MTISIWTLLMIYSMGDDAARIAILEWCDCEDMHGAGRHRVLVIGKRYIVADQLPGDVLSPRQLAPRGLLPRRHAIYPHVDGVRALLRATTAALRLGATT